MAVRRGQVEAHRENIRCSCAESVLVNHECVVMLGSMMPSEF